MVHSSLSSEMVYAIGFTTFLDLLYGMIISILYTFCFIFPGALQIFHGYLSRKIEYPPNKTQVFSAWSIQIFGAHIEAI
jgi:hypothetical protein